jgi:hypothetical protein
MIPKDRNLSLLMLIAVLSTNCSLMKFSSEKLFEIKDAFYQSWVISESEKGTSIVIEITNIKEGVVFDSIIFRGLKLPVFIEEKDGITYLKSLLNIELSKISLESKVTDEPDKIIYHYQTSKRLYDLKNIRRLKMKYY